MTATELEEVQSLLERVLPDPRGFAGRLLEQAITQYGQFAPRAAATYYTAATTEDTTLADAVIVADEWIDADDQPVDVTVLLAAALGACECWGMQADCDVCQGHGSAGWTQPDPDLFEEFVRPAVDRLPSRRAGGHRQHDREATEQHHRNHQTVQGEKT